MRRTLLVFMVTVLVAAAWPLQASERHDIDPGERNWHRYRFFVIAVDAVAVRQSITVLWDNPGTGMLIALFDTEDPINPTLTAISAGHDRHVSLDLGLMDGPYELVIGAVLAPTHYHLNVTYGNDELLFRQPNGPLSVQTDPFTDRLIAEQLAPHVARLQEALR